ncbi:amino acid ABC transporter permease [Spirochaeta isovalerica]|uniref:His/Glu/Gln/Arg/opine family amino acid ABC transporter permease subunit n=1 Tax=Spirochaeta isovalerica TaxID=150 RepID=A0A841RBE7_9SPIO|nr:amino acid ABC transporter permease [Spirochaeta isovalerica]MBB6481026.1 His/Glu/Gln/Arg/opine family amino acid ABC transporter permease subunit [Spirochaeta isovalerica]
MKDYLKKLINIRQWEQSSKTTAIIIVAVVLLFIVLSVINVSESAMMDHASAEVKQMIEDEKDSSRKRLTITYNDFKAISYLSFTTSGAKALQESYVGFAGNIFQADEGVGKFTGQMINYTYRMLGIKQNFLHGVKLTMLLTTLSILIGFVFSIFLALGKISKNVIISKLSSAYIFFFRGTPLLIQLFVVYFSVPGIFGFSWRGLFDISDPEAVYKGAFIAALIAFSLNAAAYCAEIVRAAIQSIDKGQHEASKTLGLGYAQTMTHIIIPQATRRMIPPLANEFIMMIKDVSLVFAISLMDITTISKTIMTSEGSYLVFLPALVIYLIVTAIFTRIFGKMEERLSVYE